MGFFDILSDIYSSVTIRNVDAEEPPPSGTMNDSRNAGVRGGASSNLPAALDGSSSKAEAEANKADAKGGDNGLDVHLPKEKGDEGEAGDDEEEHEEGASKGEGEDKDEEVEDAEEQEEEEEEEEEEPVDIKPKLEDGQ